MVVDVYTVRDGVRKYWGSFENSEWARYHIGIAKAFGNEQDGDTEFEMEDRL